LIHWWWADKDAPWAGFHHYGSNNWSHPDSTFGGLGEDPSVIPVWRDGSKPPGACGEQPQTCWQLTGGPPLHGDLFDGRGVAHAFTFEHDQVADVYSGFTLGGVDVCGGFSVQMQCLPSAQGPDYRTLHIDCYTSGPGVPEVHDIFDLDVKVGTSIYDLNLALVGITQACGTPGNTGAECRISPR